MPEVRDADLSRDVDDLARLWLSYLTWGNDELAARYGFRLPVQEAVDRDVEEIAKFSPPDGRLVVATEDGETIGTAALRRIGPATAEIKRMWVDPERRRGGTGRAMLAALLSAASRAGYDSVRLDSPDFMTAAHALYRSEGFVEIEPYPESEIPDTHKSHWVFMEKRLR